MTLAIIMRLMGCINVPMESGERVGKKCEVQFASGIEIFEKFFFNLPQSSSSGCLTHVVRNAIVG
jgi:hypothetical protein